VLSCGCQRLRRNHCCGRCTCAARHGPPVADAAVTATTRAVRTGVGAAVSLLRLLRPLLRHGRRLLLPPFPVLPSTNAVGTGAAAAHSFHSRSYYSSALPLLPTPLLLVMLLLLRSCCAPRASRCCNCNYHRHWHCRRCCRTCAVPGAGPRPRPAAVLVPPPLPPRPDLALVAPPLARYASRLRRLCC